MAQQSSIYNTPLSTINWQIDPVGSKALSLVYDFSLQGLYSTDLTPIVQQGKFAGVQAIFIDNANNNAPVEVLSTAFDQAISIGAGYQGYFPVVSIPEAKFLVSSTGAGIANLSFLNFPMSFGIWPAMAPASANSGLPDTDYSGTITTGGTFQLLMPANSSRTLAMIQNIDSANLEVLYISSDSTPSSLNAFQLAEYSAVGFPGGTITLSTSNALYIMAATTGHKFAAIGH